MSQNKVPFEVPFADVFFKSPRDFLSGSNNQHIGLFFKHLFTLDFSEEKLKIIRQLKQHFEAFKIDLLKHNNDYKRWIHEFYADIQLSLGGFSSLSCPSEAKLEIIQKLESFCKNSKQELLKLVNNIWEMSIDGFIAHAKELTEDKTRFLTVEDRLESGLISTLRNLIKDWLDYTPTGSNGTIHKAKQVKDGYVLDINTYNDYFRLPPLDLYLQDLHSFFTKGLNWKNYGKNIYEVHIRVLFHLHAIRFGAKYAVSEKRTCRTSTLFDAANGLLCSFDLYIPNTYVIELKLFKAEIDPTKGLDTSNGYKTVRDLLAEAVEQARSCYGFSEKKEIDERKIPRVGIVVTPSGIHYQVASEGYSFDAPPKVHPVTTTYSTYLCYYNADQEVKIRDALTPIQNDRTIFKRICGPVRKDTKFNLNIRVIELATAKSLLEIKALLPEIVEVYPTYDLSRELLVQNVPYSYWDHNYSDCDKISLEALEKNDINISEPSIQDEIQPDLIKGMESIDIHKEAK